MRDLAGQHGQRPEVVVVGVRDHDVVDGAAFEQFERRERRVAVLVRVHAGVEDQAGAAEREVVAGGGDLVGVAQGEVLHSMTSGLPEGTRVCALRFCAFG